MFANVISYIICSFFSKHTQKFHVTSDIVFIFFNNIMLPGKIIAKELMKFIEKCGFR